MLSTRLLFDGGGGEGRGGEKKAGCGVILGMMMVYLCTKPFSNARPI